MIEREGPGGPMLRPNLRIPRFGKGKNLVKT